MSVRVFSAFGTAWLAAMVLITTTQAAYAQPVLYAGSDTTEPVVEAAVLAYTRARPTYKPSLKATGTTPGFKEVCAGRALMAGASRPIKADEAKTCATSGIQLVEVPVALDAVVMVTSVKNTWLKDLTLADVAKLFDPASAGKLTSWKQIRPTFPDLPIKPAGVDIKHATFAFFTESLGLNGFIRADYKDFKTHAATGTYVAADPGAVGFMPLGEAKTLEGQVRAIALDFGSGPVNPGPDEIAAGKYDKLSRTVYLYINTALLAKMTPEDNELTNLLVRDMDKFVRFANMVPLRALQYQENVKRVAGAR